MLEGDEAARGSTKSVVAWDRQAPTEPPSSLGGFLMSRASWQPRGKPQCRALRKHMYITSWRVGIPLDNTFWPCKKTFTFDEIAYLIAKND